MKNIRTENLIHPGELLREEFMKPLNISQNALAIAMHVPATRIGEIINEKRGISADIEMPLLMGTVCIQLLKVDSVY